MGLAMLLLLPLLPLALFLLLRYAEQRSDAREPPLLRPRIPLLGHTIGILTHGSKYFAQTSARINSPIYTLPVPGSRLYVISDPALTTQCFRLSKALTFTPFIKELGCRLTGASSKARRIIEYNMDGSLSKEGYVIEIHDRTIQALTPGPELNRISHCFLRDLTDRYLAPLESHLARHQTKSIGLLAIIQEFVTFSSTTGLYGARNPFLQDRSLADDFWTYNSSLNPLLLDLPLQHIWFSKVYHARERISAAFAAYFEADPRGVSSSMAEARYEIAKKHGHSFLDMGRLELGMVIGILSNTVPIVFWMLYHIFSDPALLSSLRSEIETCALQGGQTIDMLALRSKCALLHSTLQEALRVYSHFAAVRYVDSDVLLANTWMLKKGSVVQLPNTVMHRATTLWGNESEEFQPKHFLESKRSALQTKGAYSIDPAAHSAEGTSSAGAFRPFGGGTSKSFWRDPWKAPRSLTLRLAMCPGRHFAAMEVLGLVAIFVLRFDISAETSWEPIPKGRYESVVAGVYPPDRDIDVVIHQRPAAPSHWDFHF